MGVQSSQVKHLYIFMIAKGELNAGLRSSPADSAEL